MTASPLRFSKYEGLGNDFLVVEAEGASDLSAEDARALCDRRFGVGGDGVLLVWGARSGAYRMKVLNADGSVPEMCGNGLRCAALHVARARGGAAVSLSFETDAGPRGCEIDPADEARVASVTVDMGVVTVGETRTISLEGRAFTVTEANAGNPHAIVHESVSPPEHESVGRALATHASFPRGTNVEMVSWGRDAVDLVVYERGVGLTLACGTGACATVMVGCRQGKLDFGRPVEVRLPGGALVVTASPDGRVTMRGPARLVFEGEVSGWRARAR